MNRWTTTIVLVLALAGLSLVACSDDGSSNKMTDPQSTASAVNALAPADAEAGASLARTYSPAGRSFVLRFATTAIADPRPIPPIDGSGTDEGLCFDGDLIDLATGRVIGTATDCLADIGGNPVDGLDLVGTTTFYLPGGTITSRGNTSVQPITTDPAGTPITHVTGAIPNDGDNGIIGGTGRFAGASGTVRLSGAVNLSRLDSHGEITFDCLFTISLD